MTQIIAIAGGSGSAKTTLARHLLKSFGSHFCAIISQDSYYVDQSAKFDRDGGAVNFDDPSALEFSLLAEHLQELSRGKEIEVPQYDFSQHKRLRQIQILEAKPFILVDGILLLSQAALLPFFTESIFLALDEDTRFERRLKRDVRERGRTPEGVREQFYKQVKPMHDQYVEPSARQATILIKDGRHIIEQEANSSDLRQRLLGYLQEFVDHQP